MCLFPEVYLGDCRDGELTKLRILLPYGIQQTPNAMCSIVLLRAEGRETKIACLPMIGRGTSAMGHLVIF
jgi:hypothetical protein